MARINLLRPQAGRYFLVRAGMRKSRRSMLKKFSRSQMKKSSILSKFIYLDLIENKMFFSLINNTLVLTSLFLNKHAKPATPDVEFLDKSL